MCNIILNLRNIYVAQKSENFSRPVCPNLPNLSWGKQCSHFLIYPARVEISANL